MTARWAARPPAGPQSVPALHLKCFAALRLSPAAGGRNVIMMGFWGEYNVPMDFLVLTPEQYERQKGIIGTIVRQADREGKVIYEQAA